MGMFGAAAAGVRSVRSPGTVIIDGFELTNMSARDRTGVLSESSKNS